jgi:FkbM family methyltransferase
MLIDSKTLSQYFTNGTPKGVIHVGAHAAEELSVYDSLGVDSVIWVEANPLLFGGLLSKIQDHIGSSAYCFAAFDKDGEHIELNIANNGESSSIFNFGTHSEEHPHIHYVGKIKVPTLCIDTLLDKKGFDTTSFDFVNIDVQGAELLVLKGMKNQLKNIKYAYLEVNEKPLYDGCSLIQEIDEFLKEFGFERVLTKMTQHGWGDALYMKFNGENMHVDR